MGPTLANAPPKQHWPNNFVDLSNHSLRNIDDERKTGMGIMTEIVANNLIASQLHNSTLCVCVHPFTRHSLWRFLGPQLGLLFFEFELKPTGKDRVDPTQQLQLY